jgi:PPM family protein phosphatase
MPSSVAFATSTGLVRRRNEDSAYVGRWLCAVADGMGGHAAGDIASATVIDSIRPFDLAVDESASLTAVLGAAIRRANDRLAAKVATDPSLISMGSTLTALLWSGSHVAVANIGDSRAYLLRNGSLRRITEDHVMSKLVARPMPTDISEYLVRFLDARPGWSPDLTLRAVNPGDRYVVCSDGLSGFVGEHAIRDVMASASDPDEVLDALMRLTREAGAPDNVTMIVVDVPDGAWTERTDPPAVLGAAATLAEVG